MKDCADVFANIVLAPGYTTSEYPDATLTSDVDRIEAFQSSYSFWILQFAEQLNRQPNAGFAILAVLNSYPELIANLKELVNAKPKEASRRKYQAGLLDIFPELKTLRNRNAITGCLYDCLRCGLAHAGLTGNGIILSGDIEEPISTCVYKGKRRVIVNPHLWYERTRVHFENYCSQLSNPENVEVRAMFLRQSPNAC